MLFLAGVAYLLVPALIFTAGFLAWPLALATTAAGATALALSPGWHAGWPLRRNATLACLAGGMAWAVLATGTHHQLYAAVDWQIRDAVLHDLALDEWPVVYVIGDLAWLLRAPLGYYMPAALVGRALAPEAALPALFLWTALGLALVLMLLVTLANSVVPGRRRGALWLALVFIGFGGLDLLPNLWLDGTEGNGIASYWGRGGEWWARVFQYSGHATLVLWAPNHALPAWIPALLLLRHAWTADFRRSAALPLAAAAFWAPLSALGAGVLIAFAVLSRGGAGLRSALSGAPNWLALVLAAPAALFLTAGSAAIPHGFLLTRTGWEGVPVTLLFLLVEVFAIAIPVLLLLRSRLLVASLVLLVLLPFYVFGPGNEMTMRGGIAPLTVLAVSAGLALWRDGHAWARRALVAALLVGAAGQVMEASILAHSPWRPSQGCTLPEAAAQSVFTNTDWSHYVVPWPEQPLDRILAPPQELSIDPMSVSRCWPASEAEPEAEP